MLRLPTPTLPPTHPQLPLPHPPHHPPTPAHCHICPTAIPTLPPTHPPLARPLHPSPQAQRHHLRLLRETGLRQDHHPAADRGGVPAVQCSRQGWQAAREGRGGEQGPLHGGYVPARPPDCVPAHLPGHSGMHGGELGCRWVWVLVGDVGGYILYIYNMVYVGVGGGRWVWTVGE